MYSRRNGSSVRIYFSEFFGINPDVIEQYGALNVSLVADLPLFIDPFLLFNSNKDDYQSLHNEIIKYLQYLRGISVQSQFIDKGLLEYLFVFKEVKQNWLGYSRIGNQGSGLGPEFAEALHTNLNRVFSNFGQESVTKSSHLEKLCLIKEKVGKDNISDFTINLIKKYLLNYTQKFARKHLSKDQRKSFAVDRVQFNYETNSWMSENFELPLYHKNYIILTPKDMLTKDETWINKQDLYDSFEDVVQAIPNEQLRAKLNMYLISKLPKNKEPTKKEFLKVVADAVFNHPEVIDYYIKYKEERGDEAKDISQERVLLTETQFIEQVKSFVSRHLTRSSFYYLDPDDPEDSQDRILILKDIIENENGSGLYYINGKAISRETELQLLMSILWRAVPSSIISTPSRKFPPVEFKLASNGKLAKTFEKRKEKCVAGQQPTPLAIVSFNKQDLENSISRAVDNGLQADAGIVFIDASDRNRNATTSRSAKMIKILFLAASPEDEVWLRVDKEMRDVRTRLRATTHRDLFEVTDEPAVRVTDIQDHLLRHSPTVVHFSGHGGSSGELIFEDQNGLGQVVQLQALRQLFSIVKDSIRCVVLNACYSEIQAKAIAEVIECVVGMSDSIDDDSAIAFSSSFYQALGYGKSIKTAYALGCNEIQLRGLYDYHIPQLLVRDGVDPEQVFLVKNF